MHTWRHGTMLPDQAQYELHLKTAPKMRSLESKLVQGTKYLSTILEKLFYEMTGEKGELVKGTDVPAIQLASVHLHQGLPVCNLINKQSN